MVPIILEWNSESQLKFHASRVHNQARSVIWWHWDDYAQKFFSPLHVFFFVQSRRMMVNVGPYKWKETSCESDFVQSPIMKKDLSKVHFKSGLIALRRSWIFENENVEPCIWREAIFLRNHSCINISISIFHFIYLFIYLSINSFICFFELSNYFIRLLKPLCMH